MFCLRMAVVKKRQKEFECNAKADWQPSSVGRNTASRPVRPQEAGDQCLHTQQDKLGECMAAIQETREHMSLVELRRAMLNADMQRRFDMRALGLTDEQITAYDANQGIRLECGEVAEAYPTRTISA